MAALSGRNYINVCPLVSEIFIKLPEFGRNNAGTIIKDFSYDYNEVGSPICTIDRM